MGTHNILLVGDSGMHKTFFLGGCPNPFVYDFDKGLQTDNLEDRIPHATFRDIPREWKHTPEMEKHGLYPVGQGWMKFIKHLNDMMDKLLTGREKYETIGLDSLTFMQELAMSKILDDQKEPVPHQGSYGAQQKYLKTVLNALTVLPVNVVATAHIQRDTNDLTQVVEKLPLLTGKLAGLIGAFFEEVYFIDTVADATQPRKMKWVVRTAPTPMNRQAKSRSDVPDGTELSWSAVVPFLEAKGAASVPGVIQFPGLMKK
jgi:hypothetical protein